jgi:hypothetical protein
LVTCKWWCTKKAHLKGISLFKKNQNAPLCWQPRSRLCACSTIPKHLFNEKDEARDGGKQDKLSQCTAGPDFCSKSVNKSNIIKVAKITY